MTTVMLLILLFMILRLSELVLCDICVQDAVLFEVVRNGVLRQKRRLELDFGSHPFSFQMGRSCRMFASSTGAELRAEAGALDFVKLLEISPGLVAYGSGDIDFQLHNGHKKTSTTETRRHRELRGVYTVEHQVNYDSGDRDIEPERKRPACDQAMAVETLAQGAAQGDDDHGHDDCCQNRV